MSKILFDENFKNQLKQIKVMDWDVSVSRGNPVLQQTKKNACKRELLVGLRNWLSEELAEIANVHYVQEGVAIELESDVVASKVPEGNGFITLVLDLKFKDLGYDALTEADAFETELAAREEAKKVREAKKGNSKE